MTIRGNFCFKASKVRWLRYRRSNPLPPNNFCNSSQKTTETKCRQILKREIAGLVKNIYGNVPDPFKPLIIFKDLFNTEPWKAQKIKSTREEVYQIYTDASLE